MPPICESRRYVTNLSSSHNELELDYDAGNSASFPKGSKNIITLDETQKLAYDAKELKGLKTKETALDNKNYQEKQNGVDSVSRSRTSLTKPEKYHPKGLKDTDTYVDKLEELFQQQSELQQYLDDDEISDGNSDTKATVKAEIPTELESVRVNEENIQSVIKCSGDYKGTSKEANSDNEDDDDPPDKDDDNQSEAANEIAASEDSDVAAIQMRTYGEDSDIPIGEANECASPVDKANFVIGVVSTTETQVKGQLGPKYLPVAESKNSNWVPDHTLTDVVSLNAATNYNYVAQNDNLLVDLPKEEQTVATVTNSNGACATTFQTVDDIKLQDTSIYPYFSAPAGAAGDSPMESSHGNSEPLGDDDDDDIISLEGSVSDNTSFKSGPADASDP